MVLPKGTHALQGQIGFRNEVVGALSRGMWTLSEGCTGVWKADHSIPVNACSIDAKRC